MRVSWRAARNIQGPASTILPYPPPPTLPPSANSRASRASRASKTQGRQGRTGQTGQSPRGQDSCRSPPNSTKKAGASSEKAEGAKNTSTKRIPMDCLDCSGIAPLCALLPAIVTTRSPVRGLLCSPGPDELCMFSRGGPVVLCTATRLWPEHGWRAQNRRGHLALGDAPFQAVLAKRCVETSRPAPLNAMIGHACVA